MMLEKEMNNNKVLDLALIDILVRYKKHDEVLDAIREIKTLFVSDANIECCKAMIGGSKYD